MYALNVGETDYTSKLLDEIDYKDKQKKTDRQIKADILSLAKETKIKEYESDRNEKGKPIENNISPTGEYIGKYYHTHTIGGLDRPVTTRVRQLVDYVDNDATFIGEENIKPNYSWKTTTITELKGSGYESSRLLSRDVLADLKIEDDHERNYMTDENKNILLSVDEENTITDTLHNKGFEEELIRATNTEELNTREKGGKPSRTEIGLTISKTVAAEADVDNLAYENITEIVKFENSVGRRNFRAVPGNSNPKKGVWEEGLKEIDSSATELVTFIPPTGIEAKSVITTQLIIIITISLTMIAAGIVFIKKKVLTKQIIK